MKTNNQCPTCKSVIVKNKIQQVPAILKNILNKIKKIPNTYPFNVEIELENAAETIDLEEEIKENQKNIGVETKKKNNANSGRTNVASNLSDDNFNYIDIYLRSRLLNPTTANQQATVQQPNETNATTVNSELLLRNGQRTYARRPTSNYTNRSPAIVNVNRNIIQSNNLTSVIDEVARGFISTVNTAMANQLVRQPSAKKRSSTNANSTNNANSNARTITISRLSTNQATNQQSKRQKIGTNSTTVTPINYVNARPNATIARPTILSPQLKRQRIANTIPTTNSVTITVVPSVSRMVSPNDFRPTISSTPIESGPFFSSSTTNVHSNVSLNANLSNLLNTNQLTTSLSVNRAAVHNSKNSASKSTATKQANKPTNNNRLASSLSELLVKNETSVASNTRTAKPITRSDIANKRVTRSKLTLSALGEKALRKS